MMCVDNDYHVASNCNALTQAFTEEIKNALKWKFFYTYHCVETSYQSKQIVGRDFIHTLVLRYNHMVKLDGNQKFFLQNC